MLKPIKTKKDYKTTLNRIAELMDIDIAEGSNEYNELEVLAILVDDYETKNFPIDLPDPVEAIKFRLEQLDLGTTDLVKIFGSKSRTSEILSRKRKLSISMIRKLHRSLNIPASTLISDYPLS